MMKRPLRGKRGCQGVALLDSLLSLTLTAGLSAIALSQLPQLIDQADRQVTEYARVTSLSAHLIQQQYEQASGNASAVEVALVGLEQRDRQVQSPLGYYCYELSGHDLSRPMSPVTRSTAP